MCQQPLFKCLVMAPGLCSHVFAVNVAEWGVWCLCYIVSSTGKVAARRENNAHKRLSEEASGADVFHMALNGAAAQVCVCVLNAYE